MAEIEYWYPDHRVAGGLERFVERAARCAYRSQDKITEDSYKEFLQRIVVKHRDHSVVEHVGLYIDPYIEHYQDDLIDLLQVNSTIPYIPYPNRKGIKLLITGRHVLEIFNSEIWRSNKLAEQILHWAQPYFRTLYTFPVPRPLTLFGVCEAAHNVNWTSSPRFILATYFVKGVSRVTETQWVRHRKLSYTVMSGRGVDFRDQEIYIPESVTKASTEYPTVLAEFTHHEGAAQIAVNAYTALRDEYKIPRQDARYLLPQGTTTEMVVTATLENWNYFFSLRSVKPAQAEIRMFSRMIQTDLHKRYPGYVPEPEKE